MTDYTAPTDDMAFVINELADLTSVSQLPGCADATPDLVAAILEEAGKFGAGVLAPLNTIGDQQGSALENGVVRTADGFKEAYKQFCDAGWASVPFDPEHGGQGLPWLVATPICEIWNAANLAWALCPLLSQGASELVIAHGDDSIKERFLEKMVSGEWPGTMNLTESQAGSDLAQIRTKAIKDGDAYRISGQKIFISYGDHDYSDNIIHLVLARLPDAPAGVKGISLFVVPKILLNDDGSLGAANDVKAVSVEHKLGIHASPTCVMSFGDNDGAIGYLVGEENQGLGYMFTMMNNARLGVGLQGIAVADRAYQQARAYAFDRVQSRPADGSSKEPTAIVKHPDVKRMLMSMKALTEANRALSYYVASCLDKSKRHTDPSVRRYNHALVDLLIPVVKAWGTDSGVEVASLGVQVHGGMGYIEESGAPQYYRDARITPIYEGTNGIQAADLVGRKIAREKGLTINSFISIVRGLDKELATVDTDSIVGIRSQLTAATDALEVATSWLLRTFSTDPNAVSAGAVHYLKLLGIVAGGWMMARAALVAHEKLTAGDGDPTFMNAKVATARFFADHQLAQADMLASVFMQGAEAVNSVADDWL